MRAVVLTEFGPPERLALAELPDPVAGPGQVVISVGFAGVTFVETQIRSGRPPHPSMTPALPVVLGNGVGGTVAAIGPGVRPGLLGSQFVTATSGSGGYAELAAVPADALIPIPAGVPVDHAVALLADGRTALALIQSVSIGPGETVLVEAAAGGVGSLLVQLARNAGATVVAAAGGQRKVDVAAGLGAAMAVDYSEQGWPGKVRAAVGPVSVVFDGVGGTLGATAFSLLRDGGKMCMFGMASGSFTSVPVDEVSDRHISVLRGVPVSPAMARELTAAALDLADRGTMRPLIGQRFELGDAAQAHAAIESRSTIGKTLLTVP